MSYRMKPGTARVLKAIVDAALRGQLGGAISGKLYEIGPDAVALAMLSTSRHIAVVATSADSLMETLDK